MERVLLKDSYNALVNSKTKERFTELQFRSCWEGFRRVIVIVAFCFQDVA